MTQFYSRVDTEFNGDVYSIPFSYIKEEEIQVYIGDELYTDWYFLNDSQIKINNLPSDLPSNTIVSVRRLTDISKKEVEYTNNTLLNKENLNLSQDQLLHAVQEIYDNNIQFEIDTLKVIQENKEEVLDTVQENKEEVLGIQQTFEDEVNHKIQEVSEAASKINALEEAVDTAIAAANTATEQASIATDTTQEIIAASEELKDAMDKTVEEINDKITNFDTSLEEKTVELIREADRQINNIQSTGFYMRDDKLYFINSKGEEEEFKSGGAGAVMFDTKISDHILQGEEAKGWALQGTYVTKESYPDFYNKCLDEYRNSTEEIIGVEPWTQPIATANTTSVDGGNMVISASSEYTGSQEYAWKAMDGNTTSTHFSLSSTNTGWWQVKFPYKLLIKGLTYYSRAKASTYPVKTAAFYTSSDMTQQIGDTFSAPTTDYTAFEVQNIPQDGVITDTIYLSLKGDGSTCGMGELVINAQKLTSDIYYTIYKNNNGHKFYPIEQKSAFDTIYNQYGIADFYGIDEENERIFLPRNKFFAVTGGVMGNGMGLGLMTAGTSATLSAESIYNNNGTLRPRQPIGQFISDKPVTGDSIPATQAYITGVTTDPTKSGIVLQPNEDKYLYYCVGNTEVTQSITNVTEITESENDSNPLGSSFYFKNIQPNAGWLKSEGQWNSGNIYKTFYNWLVDEKTTNILRTDIKDVSEEYTDFDYVLNQDEMNFRLPLLNGSESLPSGKYDNLTLNASGSTYIAPANGWYYISKKGEAGHYLQIVRNGTGSQNGQASINRSHANNSNVNVEMEVKKGDYITVNYDLAGTTDAFRFIYAQGNGSLYFKVANAVQNLELLDAGKVSEGLAKVSEGLADKADKSEVDGQWVKFSRVRIYQATTIGNFTIDLSDYLPNDNYIYEVLLGGLIQSNNSCACDLSSSVVASSDGTLMFMQSPNGSGNATRTNCIIPIGVDRTLGVHKTGVTPTSFSIYLFGYRRVGTNV